MRGQRDLFRLDTDLVETRRFTREEIARAKGEDASRACTERAEQSSGFDTKGAREEVLRILDRHGRMSSEDIVDRLKIVGFQGHDDRCFGAIFSKLARDRKIRCIAFCRRRRGHGTAGGRIWEAVPA